jgi:hypothetical protein
MTINVIQHDGRLWYLRLFYNGTFSIASKNDAQIKIYCSRLYIIIIIDILSLGIYEYLLFYPTPATYIVKIVLILDQ